MHSDDTVVRDLEIMSEARNYNAWLYAQFSGSFGGRILEVGAGVGNFTSRLLDREIVVATDCYGPCVDYLKKEFARKKNVFPLKVDIASPEALELKKYRPDTIICMNVLEHVQDDNRALKNMNRILPRGGRAALLVPAFPFLYGTIDRLVGHYRRYTRRELRTKLTTAGFTIRELYYLNSLGAFGWLLNNRVIKRREESPAQVLFYDRAIVPWLSKIERIVRPPFGLSVVALAEKERD